MSVTTTELRLEKKQPSTQNNKHGPSELWQGFVSRALPPDPCIILFQVLLRKASQCFTSAVVGGLARSRAIKWKSRRLESVQGFQLVRKAENDTLDGPQPA